MRLSSTVLPFPPPLWGPRRAKLALEVREGVRHEHRYRGLPPSPALPHKGHKGGGSRQREPRRPPHSFDDASLTHRSAAPRTIGKNRGETHVQGSVFASWPR